MGKKTHKWTNILSYYFSPIMVKDFMQTHYLEQFIPLLPQFYKQCLIALLEIKSNKIPDSVNEVLTQRLWFNKYITIGKNPAFYRDWYMQGIEYVSDIVGVTGELLLADQIEDKFNLCKVNFLQYYALRNSIPYGWTKPLLLASKILPVPETGLDVTIKGII